MFVDEIMRSAYGFLACWPMLALCRRTGLTPLYTGLLITTYMVPAWWVYARLERLICG